MRLPLLSLFVRLVCLVLLLPLSLAWGTTRYVQGGGSGGSNCGAGAIDNPLSTIAAAINCSGPGDTVLVRGGDYNERVENIQTATVNWPRGSSWNPGGFFTLASAQNETATVRGKFTMAFTNAGNGQQPQYIKIDHVNVNMGATADTHTDVGEVAVSITIPHLLWENSDLCCANNQVIEGGDSSTIDITMRNNTIHHAYVFLDMNDWQRCNGVPSSGPCSAGGYCFYGHPSGSLWEGNTFHHCSAFALHFFHGGQSAPEIFDNVVRNNIFHHNAFNDGHRLNSMSVVIFQVGSRNQFYNNLMYDNCLGYPSCEGAITIKEDGDFVWNNTITRNNAIGIYLFPGTSSDTAQNNIVYNNTKGGLVQTPSSGHVLCAGGQPNCNYSADPGFVSAASDNFALATGAAACGQGMNLSARFATALPGLSTPRPAPPTLWASGAYECGGVIGALPPPTNFRIQSLTPNP